MSCFSVDSGANNDDLPEIVTTQAQCKHYEPIFSLHTFFLSRLIKTRSSSLLFLRNHGSLGISAAMHLQRPFSATLQCTSSDNEQNYPWGRVGESSLSARLCSKTPNTGFKIEDKPYAEMWMGDYPVQPAKSLKTGEDLHKIVDEDKERLLGKNVMEKFGGVLPFLPKILSINKALELQIHPDKDLAAKLHAKNPDQFPDDNHKPEIAIALGKFEVFVGWKATPNIQALFDVLEPIKKFLPNGQTQLNNETLKQICHNILTSSDDSIKECQEQLGKIPREKFGKQAYILDLLPRLQEQYSIEDPGNLVTLL